MYLNMKSRLESTTVLVSDHDAQLLRSYLCKERNLKEDCTVRGPGDAALCQWEESLEIRTQRL